MPLPERYAGKVKPMDAVWSPKGTFKSQADIWLAQVETRHEMSGQPTSEQVEQIREALVLSPDDIEYLTAAQGHETNNLLRRVQSRLPQEAGNYLHLGNTSSDILDTSLSLQIRESLNIVGNDFQGLATSLGELALQHRGTIQIARTHGQHAIPHTFGRQVVGWYAEVQRGIRRIEIAKEEIAVGKLSGEVETNVFIRPEHEEAALARLGLRPDEAPTQIIGRDRHATVAGLMAVNSGTLARIATNIRLLAMTDIRELEEPFQGVGSSAMPHKRNPDKAERVVGIDRRVRAAAGEELDAQISWLERDISHSSTERFSFPDTFGGLSYTAYLMQDIVDNLVVHPDRMLRNLNSTYGSIYSSRLMNALLDKTQMKRTEAYELVKGLSQKAMDEEIQLRELVKGEGTITDVLDPEELDELFDPQFYLQNIDVAYKRSGLLPDEANP